MPTAPPFQLRLHINVLGQGFSELYTLKTASFEDSLPIARNLCLYRRALMALGCIMPFASVHQVGRERNAAKCIDGPLGPYPFFLGKVGGADEAQFYPNHPDDCYYYRFETANREWANRPFRGVPDAWYNKRAVQGETWIPYAAGDAAIVAATNEAAGINSYGRSWLAYVRDNTEWHREVSPATNPRTFNVAAWTTAIFNKAGRKKCGKPFGQLAGRQY